MPAGWKGPSPAMKQAALEEKAYYQQERFVLAALQGLCSNSAVVQDSEKLAVKAVAIANSAIKWMDANPAPINRS